MTGKEKRVMREMREGFVCFTRNARWGTCVACPRDSAGNAYPEFCRFTERGDHLLTVDQLSSLWNRKMAQER